MKPLDVFLSEIFHSFETFLKKATTLNIFEGLIFNYKIKVDAVEKCSPEFLSFVVALCSELQLILKETVSEEVSKLDSNCSSKQKTSSCETRNLSPGLVKISSSENEQGDSSEVPSKHNSGKGAVFNQSESPKASTTNKTKGIYTCKFCNRKYRTNGRASKHVCKSGSALETRSDEYVDDPDSNLSSDASQSSPDSESPQLPVFFCTICYATYSSRGAFYKHSHTDVSQKAELETDMEKLQSVRKFVCGVCNEVYGSLARISYHVTRCHTGPYVCELCSHTALTKTLLNKHKKRLHKGVECFFCSECGLGFKLRTSLQKHMVNRHESEQDGFNCDTGNCQLTFQKKIQLTNHKIKVHGVERKYLCQVCGHKFMTQDSLSSHLDCHSSPKKFPCHFCPKSFNTKEKMTYHVRSHTGEKPFECPLCPKSFVSKSKLSQHLQRHKGEKRHKCGVCGKLYANKPDLTAHLKKIHPPEQIVIEVPPLAPQEEPVSDMYSSSSQLLLPSATNQLFNNVQFYPELMRAVPLSHSMVITTLESIVGV